MGNRSIIFIAVLIALLGSVTFFSLSNSHDADSKPRIFASTYVLYELASEIAGETVDVKPLIPLGSDGHIYAPNPKQVSEISEAEIFIYSGAGYETWVEELLHNLSPKTEVVDMSRHVTLLQEEQDHAGEDAGTHHHEGGIDPHYWLSIDNMIKMAQTMGETFSTSFPEHRPLYQQNTQRLVGELEQLRSEYIKTLGRCENRVLVSNHDAFGYLAHDYNLRAVSVIGLSSDEQPSAKVIADTVELIKRHRVKTIFFEEFIDDNVAQTIARETGAGALSLQPLENISRDELESGKNYQSIMRENLRKIAQAMECR